MAYRIVDKAVTAIGFCCAYSYFFSVRNEGADTIAKELKVTERTARRWKAAYNTGTLDCSGLKECFFVEDEIPPSQQKYPGLTRVPSEDRDRALAEILL